MYIHAEFPALASSSDLDDLRARYLDSLPHAQDALVEVLVHGGQAHAIVVHGERVGHAVVAGDVLLEFFVLPQVEDRAHVILERLVDALGIGSALVKTFDAVLLACALDLSERVVVKGVLARHLTLRELPVIPRIRYTARTATASDMPRITAVRQEVFTHPERLRRVVDDGDMRIFERDDTVVGFGIIRTIVAGRPDVELGLAVDPPFRNKGYAVYLLRDLVVESLRRGRNPVSGLARENEASIRLGIRVGFTARHRLLQIHFRSTRGSHAS